MDIELLSSNQRLPSTQTLSSYFNGLPCRAFNRLSITVKTTSFAGLAVDELKSTVITAANIARVGCEPCGKT
jgi:hypothetical protein